MAASRSKKPWQLWRRPTSQGRRKSHCYTCGSIQLLIWRPKMYKNHISKRGLDKKNKSEEMKAILRKKTAISTKQKVLLYTPDDPLIWWILSDISNATTSLSETPCRREHTATLRRPIFATLPRRLECGMCSCQSGQTPRSRPLHK
jgi:hypothetical protein